MRTPLAFLLLAPLATMGQFTLSYDGTVPVTRAGSQLVMPWAGGVNFSQWSTIDVDGDDDLDLFGFDRSGNEVIILLKDGSPGTVQYTYTREYNDVYPFNELHDWAILRDYNCDGKADIWSYSLGGARVFKNTSTGSSLSFQLVDTLVRSNYQPTNANLYITQVDVPSVVDMDNDGDLDILSFSIFGGTYLDYHRNLSMELYGTCDSLEFEVRNRCWGYFTENINNNSVNIDDSCDYNVPNPEMPLLVEALTAQLRAEHHHPEMGDEALERAHVGSTVTALDLDGDSVKDILVGDVLFPNLVALFNDGEVDSGHIFAQDSLFPVYDVPVDLDVFPVPNHLDIDGDGKRDLVASANNTSLAQNFESMWYYHNTGTDLAPIFDFQQVDLFQDEMIECGEGAYPVLFDHNGDGLMDIVVADYGYYGSGGIYPCKMTLLENTGTSTSPAFTQITDDYQSLSTSGIGQAMYPAFADLDNDGDQDMYVGELQGKLYYFENIATGPVADFVLTTPQVPDAGGTVIDVGQWAKPQFFDVDGDGKTDMLVGERNGNINYYRNIGSLTAPAWNLVNDSLGGVVVAEYWNVTGYSVPYMFINGAGERELLVGSESGWIWDFDNIDGNLTGTFNLVDSTWQDVKDGAQSSVVLYDFNGDTWKDAVTGNYRGGLAYWRNDFGMGIPTSGTLNGQAFALAPNPSNGSTELVLGIPLSTGMELSVFNPVGQQVARVPVVDRRTPIDTRTWADGVYTLRLSDRGTAWSQRLVVMH